MTVGVRPDTAAVERALVQLNHDAPLDVGDRVRAMVDGL